MKSLIKAELTILIPCRNEAKGILYCLERVVTVLPDAEVLIIDGSRDETESIVKEFSSKHSQVRYIRNFPDLGKGHAIQLGINQSQSRFICQLDADLQFHPEEIKNLMLPLIENEADMTLGSRFMRGSVRNPGSTPFLRFFGNFSISLYASLLTQHRMTDVLAGIKAWRQEVTQSFSLQNISYSYEAELPMRAIQKGWRVKDVPVSTDARVCGVSSVRIFRDGWKLLRDITVIWKSAGA